MSKKRKRVMSLELLEEGNDHYCERDYSNAFKSYVLFLEECDEDSEHIVSMYYKLDQIAKRGKYSDDIEKWLKKRKETGRGIIPTLMGTIMWDVYNDSKAAMTYYEKGCEYNNSESQLNLGYYYLAIVLDKKRALELFLKSAKQGNQVACDKIGEAYQRSLYGLKKDLRLAAHYYRKGTGCLRLDQLLTSAEYTPEEYWKLEDEVHRLKSEKIVRKYLIDVLSEITCSYI